MNIQGRPTRPTSASPAGRGSFTGNRALDIEEALIFETGRLDASGVDIEDPAPFVSRLGGHAAHRRDRPSRPHRAGGGAPLRAPFAQQLFDRRRALSARLLHDEAQSASQRENGAPTGLLRRSSAATDLHGPGRARTDRRPRASAPDDDGHERGRDVAQSGRAWRIVRHDGDQGRDRGARRRKDAHMSCSFPIPRTAPIRPRRR